MKKASKTWYNYLISVAIISLSVGGSLLPYYLKSNSNWSINYTFYTMMLVGVLLLLFGFIAQDIYRAVIRHKINDWDNELDEKYKNKAWSIYYPLFVSGIILIVSALLLNFFIK